MLRPLFLALALAGSLEAAIDLRLPTENHHLLTGEPERFFMYVDRNFEGQLSKPWEGGCFGLVRNSLRLDDQVICTKFHEGIDISPLHRDSAGNPLDLVASIAEGKVVHTSPIAGRSNYGKYVVVEHQWDNSAVYSLYAHLADITCNVGDAVKAGAPLGRMGFTGAGIDRTRAHLHLEITLLLSQHYDEWYQPGSASTNYHGNFNGMNLTGCDAARFFTEQKANPELRFSDFISSIPVYFKVTVPSKGTPDFVTRYPWICRGNADAAVSWEISFSATGLPVAFTASQRMVDAPIITSVLPSTIPHRYLTRNLVIGQDHRATLTPAGRHLVAILTDEIPLATTAKAQASPEVKSMSRTN